MWLLLALLHEFLYPGLESSSLKVSVVSVHPVQTVILCNPWEDSQRNGTILVSVFTYCCSIVTTADVPVQGQTGAPSFGQDPVPGRGSGSED